MEDITLKDTSVLPTKEEESPDAESQRTWKKESTAGRNPKGSYQSVARKRKRKGGRVISGDANQEMQ